MISSLAPCFTGIFLWYKDGLSLPGEHDSSIPGRSLLDAKFADELLSRFAETYSGADQRAVVSMWTQWHFGALIIPTTAAILLLDRDLPVELDSVSLALHEDGRTAAIILPSDGESRRADATDRFSRLFDGHIEPLVDHFASHFRVSRRLLWTNAATVYEWTLRQAGAFKQVCPEAMAEGRALLERRTDASGRPNPLSGAIQYCEQDGQLAPKRKVCCLRYLLPNMEDCGNICPLPARSR